MTIKLQSFNPSVANADLLQQIALHHPNVNIADIVWVFQSPSVFTSFDSDYLNDRLKDVLEVVLKVCQDETVVSNRTIATIWLYAILDKDGVVAYQINNKWQNFCYENSTCQHKLSALALCWEVANSVL